MGAHRRRYPGAHIDDSVTVTPDQGLAGRRPICDEGAGGRDGGLMGQAARRWAGQAGLSDRGVWIAPRWNSSDASCAGN